MAKLNEKDKRALKMGAAGVAVVLVFFCVTEVSEYWKTVRGELASVRSKLRTIAVSQEKQAKLLEIVPVFEMPADEETQKFLFRKRLNEQLKKAGVKGEPLQFLSLTKSKVPGYKLLRMQCRKGKTDFGKALDLLSQLKENPYLAGIEEFSMKLDAKDKRKVELNLTVSTYVKAGKAVKGRS